MNLKNISWGTLLTSKTFWGGIGTFGSVAFHAYGEWIKGNKAQALTELIAGFSVLIGAIGIKDATSGPVN